MSALGGGQVFQPESEPVLLDEGTTWQQGLRGSSTPPPLARTASFRRVYVHFSPAFRVSDI